MTSKLNNQLRKNLAESILKDKFKDKYNLIFEKLQKELEETYRENSLDSYFKNRIDSENLNFVNSLDSAYISVKNYIPHINAKLLLDRDSPYVNSFTIPFNKKVYGLQYYSEVDISNCEKTINEFINIFYEANNFYELTIKALNQIKTIKQLQLELPWIIKFLPNENKQNQLIDLEAINTLNNLMTEK